MASNNRKLLVFVEDPGAANFVIELPEALKEKGIEGKIFAAGNAISYLKTRKQSYTDISGASDCEVKKLMSDLEPDAILVGTSENKKSNAFTLIRQAKEANIASVAIVDAPTSIEDRFKGETNNSDTFITDYIIYSEASAKEALKKLGVNDNNLIQVKHPYYKIVVNKCKTYKQTPRSIWQQKLFPNKNKKQKLIVFLSELSSGLNEQDFVKNKNYTLQGTGGSIERTQIVFEELLHAIEQLPEKPYLVVRLHPKENSKKYSAYSNKVDAFSQEQDPHEITYSADIVVGLSTSLLAESNLIGANCISILPKKEERSWLPQVTEPEIEILHYRNEIINSIQNKLEHKINSENAKHSKEEGVDIVDAISNVINTTYV